MLFATAGMLNTREVRNNNKKTGLGICHVPKLFEAIFADEHAPSGMITDIQCARVIRPLATTLAAPPPERAHGLVDAQRNQRRALRTKS